MIWNNIPYLLVVVLGFSSLIGPVGTYLRETKNKAYLLLAILGIFTGPVWALSTTSFLVADTYPVALFWARVIYIASISIAFTHYFFSINYLKKKKSNVIMGLFVVLGFFFLGSQILFTDNFIQTIILEGENYVQVGWAYLYWVIWLVVVFSVNLIHTLTTYKTLSFIEKEQQKYLIIGNTLTVLGSFPANIIAPYFGIYEYIWFGPAIFSVANIIISYGLTQTRFQRFTRMARVVMRYMMLYLTPSILLFSGLSYFFSIVNIEGSYKYLLYGFVILILGVALKLLENLSQNVFLSEKEILKNKGEAFRELTIFEQELADICNKTLKYICENTPATKAQIFIYDDLNANSYHFFNGNWDIVNLKRIFDRIPSFWDIKRNLYKPLIRSELEYLRRKDPLKYKEYGSLLDLLKLSSVQIAYPIISGNELIGILLIRDIPEEKIFRIDELDLLDSIYSQFHVTVNKSLLYKQMESFNETLQQKVNIQTKELQTKVKELEEARRKEADMIDIMGHELRTPATIVKLNAQLLEQIIQKKDIHSLEKYVTRIKDGVEREIKLINTLLSSAKLEGDKIKIEPEEVDLKPEIEMTMHAYEKQAKQKGLKLIDNTPEKIATVFGDHARIVEIINNLTSNAVKYTEKGSVTIEASEYGSVVQLDFIDTGLGIPEKDIPNLGKKFYRVQTYIESEEGDDIDVVRPGGTGLGLYVVFELVRKMGGEVNVHSELGKGSVFSITLPKYVGQDSTKSKAKESLNMFERMGLKREENIQD